MVVWNVYTPATPPCEAGGGGGDYRPALDVSLWLHNNYNKPGMDWKYDRVVENQSGQEAPGRKFVYHNATTIFHQVGIWKAEQLLERGIVFHWGWQSHSQGRRN